jgi:hypothetical protein
MRTVLLHKSESGEHPRGAEAAQAKYSSGCPMMKRHGHCGYTPDGNAGDCVAGWSGMWSARNISVNDLAGCARHCKTCPRCQFVSFSALDDDCSWYRMCPQVIPGTSHTSIEVAGMQRQGLLRVAWLGNPPTSCGEAESDHLRTYCQQWLSLSDAAHVVPVPFSDGDRSMTFRMRRAALPFRKSADILLVPPQCCLVPSRLGSCLRDLDLQPGDPPVVVMLNKVFEGLDAKFEAIHHLTLRHRVLLVTAPAPLNDMLNASRMPRRAVASTTGWPPQIAFLGYGAAPAFYGRPSNRSYVYDVGFSGSPGRFEGRYALRAETMGNGPLLARLRAHGARIYEGGMTGSEQYIRTLASTRLWMSTTEAGDHVVTRTYEVLASGRALLLCDRNPRAHGRLGIVEGVHAAMFNSSAEFEGVVHWYMEHEDERLRMVKAARALALSHTWKNRARELVGLIRTHLRAESKRGERGERGEASRRQPLALKHADTANPFDAPCEEAFVYVDSIAQLHAECAPRYDRYDKSTNLPGGHPYASTSSTPFERLSWNCIGVADGTRYRQRFKAPNASLDSISFAAPPLAELPLGAARAMRQALCLMHTGSAHGVSIRYRLLSIHLASQRAVISHGTAARHSTSGQYFALPRTALEEVRDGKRDVATCPGQQKESRRHQHALAILMRDGVVRLDRHWGFARLLHEVSVAGGSDTVSSWISRRLDAVARERHLDRRHVVWDGEIPGIARIMHTVRLTFEKLARDYLGSDAFMSNYSAFRLPPKLDVAHYPAGFYHHDRCGHRLKAYILLTRVTETTHPLRIALGSHRTLYYSHHDMLASRFADDYVETHYSVRPVTGEAGEAFLFDTNAVHKAGGVGLAAQGVRDVLLFEFNARGRSAEMCAVDRTLPCGCSHQLPVVRREPTSGKPVGRDGGRTLPISATVQATHPISEGQSRRLSQATHWDGSLWGCTRASRANLSCHVLPRRERQPPATTGSELRLLTRSGGQDMPEALRLALQPPPPGRHFFAMSTYLPNVDRWRWQRQLPKQHRQHVRLRHAIRARFCDPQRPVDNTQLRDVLGSVRVKGGPLKYLVYASEHAVSLAARGHRQGAQPGTPWLYARGVRGCHGSWTCFFTPSLCPPESSGPSLNQSVVSGLGLELKAEAMGTELQWPGALIRAMHVALALEARLEHGLQPAARLSVERLLHTWRVHNHGAGPSSLRGAIIGMHVRRGDACETFEGYADGPLDLDAPRSCYSFHEYVAAARQLRHIYGTSSVVHLISDAAEVTAMVKAYPDFEWRTLEFNRDAVGGGTPNLRASASERVYIEARAQAADPANEQIVHSALADLMFAAESDVFVGTARSFVSKAVILLIWARTGVLPPTISLEGDILHSLIHTRGPFWSRDGLTSGSGRTINDHGWIPCVYALPDIHAHCFPCLKPPHGMIGPGGVDRCMDQSFLRALERDEEAESWPCIWQGKACPQNSEKPIY